MRAVNLLCAVVFAAAVGSRPALAGSGYEYLGEFAVTYYWVAVEDHRYAGQPRPEILRDVDGCEIAWVSADYRRRLDMEGTGRLADGRFLNVARRSEDGWRYVELDPASWGLGAADVPLVPLRSIAADPGRIAHGARLRLPAFTALELADGSAHGGHFVVDDVGAAIQARRLDVFIGDEGDLARLEALVPSHGRTPVYLWRGGTAVQDLLAAHP